MRGVVVHTVLLAVALGLAWATWTRDEEVDTEGLPVIVWRVDPDAVDSLTYTSGDRSLVVTWRSDDGERYLWGREVRVLPASVDSAGEPLPAPPPDTSVFPIGEQGEDLLQRLAPLRALRDLGSLDADGEEEYGLAEPEDTLVVTVEGGDQERLLLGSPVFGSTDRYALDPATGRAYAVSGEFVQTLESGRVRLQDRDLHGFDMSRVDRVVLTTPGSQRVRVRTGSGPQAGWAPPDEPDRTDATFVNFMGRVETLRVLDYHPELDADSLELLARLEYLDDDGDQLGVLEFYRRNGSAEEDTAYYLRTERTRILARVNVPVAERVAEDLEQLFGGEEGGAPPPSPGRGSSPPDAGP